MFVSVLQVHSLTRGLKIKDLCTSKSVMTVNITHWDAGVYMRMCVRFEYAHA
jgi:hypothetical protein